eukprot:TRINITY_DN9753_c0_g1_i1.p1 TRINITY_DN9753_c0_g1~~TRINITY_DN9753_c0_g1_i1.p1  ORF type:complete len:332 (+),score=58.81 TRINITY_DN9753_c0_g1_i1:108-1103(+)
MSVSRPRSGSFLVVLSVIGFVLSADAVERSVVPTAIRGSVSGSTPFDFVPKSGPFPGPYAFSLAQHYVLYSFAAYCDPLSIMQWRCQYCVAPGLETPAVKFLLSNETYNVFGWAGSLSDQVIISFRGTEPDSLDNWIEDLKTATMRPYPDVPNALVHDGFYEAYKAVRDQVRVAAKLLQLQNPNKPMVITGHSLGGALAQLCAVDLVQSGVVAGPVYIWNFGQPRVGNAVFAKFASSVVQHVYRTINMDDIVPHLPPTVLGFVHAPQEVWFPTNQTSYVVCSDTDGEDPDCSDSIQIEFSVEDHLTYLLFESGCHNPHHRVGGRLGSKRPV